MAKQFTFDQRYYRRFYRRPGARPDAEFTRLGEFVCAYLRYLEQPVRRVLDIGCGLGLWQDVIARHYPKARYVGVETSEYLCERYGWTRGSVVDFQARAPFDLVICQDVLQYLSHRDATAAIDNLSLLCRGALYLFVPTKADWEEICDQERTDSEVYFRSGDWYRRRLQRHFINAGGGVYVKPESPLLLWELGYLS